MFDSFRPFLTAWLVVCCLSIQPLQAQVDPSAGMLRFPDVSRSKVVFCYADDLWIVDKAGGVARPLASPPGQEQSPKFSPDGNRIAFVGNYEGDSDLYEIAVEGGTAKRKTYHPGREAFCGYTPDGSLLYSTSGFAKLSRMDQLFTISDAHPLPIPVPVPYGTNGTLDPEGEWMAYTPYSRDTRTWKRYRGGMASDIWLFNLETHESRQITEWEGTDSFPMWHAGRVYFVSDRGSAHRLNIWVFDRDSGESSQVTHFKRYDVKYPSIGPGSNGEGEIVFQVGAELRILNLKSQDSKAIRVRIPGDRPTLRPHIVDAADYIQSGGLSPNAKRVAVEARGDIWTAPVKHGSPRNLTRSSGVAERYPVWSPDGRWIAFFSDASGDYELTVIQSDGLGKQRQLTESGGVFKFDPKWSPDSKLLFFCDKGGAMYVHDVEKENTTKFDQDPYSERPDVSWSLDSKWLAYTRNLDDVARAQIRVLEVETGKTHPITSGYFNDRSPTFDREGKFLYFASNRDFSSPRYEDVGTTFIYDNTSVLIAVPLLSDFENPLLPTSDEEKWGEEPDEEVEEDSAQSQKRDEAEKKAKQTKKERKKRRKARKNPEVGENADIESEGEESDTTQSKKKFGVELDGIESRSFQIPVAAGTFADLQVTAENQLIYARRSTKGKDDEPSIRLLKLEEGKAEEVTVLSGVSSFELSADGKQLLARAGGKFYVVKPLPNQKLEDVVSTDGMRMEIDRRAEWKQIFHDAWRMERDFFYDPNMHGVNWKAMRRQYEKLLDDCMSRYDLSYVIREMISELNVGHAYYREGDVERGPSESTGLLGCKFEVADGKVVFAHLWQGGVWDTDVRNPLLAAGVKPGDKLLSVEGVLVSGEDNPYQYFQGRSGRAISMQVQTKNEEPRAVVVEPMSSDYQLRFWDGIESTRRYVEGQSDGRVGYIYVTNTSINGQNDLFRQFYSQQEKAALIIDDRWNGGGQIPTRFIELLNRPATNYWARREGKDWVWPPDSHQGPKCMLINGLAGSGGDMLPGLFKQMKLGKLIGRRTWGGLVGIQGEPPLIDGSSVTAPSFAYYETDGTWGIEGHGVDPDVEVIDDPAEMVDGGDPQLDAAIELMLQEIEDYPKPPARPEYPDRSQMGLPEADK